MGVSITRIEFAQGLPSFAALSRQYQRQTGLELRLLASVYPAAGVTEHLLPSAPELVAALAQDAAEVAAIDARYNLAKAPLTGAAAVREAAQTAKQPFTYLDRLELVVDFGLLYPIDLYAGGKRLEIWEYQISDYAVPCLVKCLVELGGHLPAADEARLRRLHRQWRKLKKWSDYRWYNRPRK